MSKHYNPESLDSARLFDRIFLLHIGQYHDIRWSGVKALSTLICGIPPSLSDRYPGFQSDSGWGQYYPIYIATCSLRRYSGGSYTLPPTVGRTLHAWELLY